MSCVARVDHKFLLQYMRETLKFFTAYESWRVHIVGGDSNNENAPQ